MISKNLDLLIKNENVVFGHGKDKSEYPDRAKKTIIFQMGKIGLNLKLEDLTIEMYLGTRFLTHVGIKGRLKIKKFKEKYPEYFI